MLRPGGVFYALFGPLWFTYGGPHISALAYDHLLLPESDFEARAAELGDGWELWLQLGLFNRLALDDYLAEFSKIFVIDRLVISDSIEGRRFRKQHPEVWRTLLESRTEKDLLVRLVSVVARPREAAAVGSRFRRRGSRGPP